MRNVFLVRFIFYFFVVIIYFVVLVVRGVDILIVGIKRREGKW